MARAIGPSGILDIKSVAVLEDLTFASNPCAAGSTRFKRERYYGSEFFRDLPEDSDLRNPEKFDRPKDWIHCACASFICMILLGILHSIGLLLPHVRSAYQMGPLHVTVISAATYSIVFCFSPMAASMVRCMGNRLTCIFGLLLVFIGLVLDALEINIFVYYLAHMVLIGFGCCFALTAAASSVMRHFRKRLMMALAVLVLATPLGTALFHILIYVFAIETTLGYKWILLTLSFFVIASIALTHPLPGSGRPPRHPNPFAERKRKWIVQDCITKVAQGEEETRQGHRQGQHQTEECCEEFGFPSAEAEPVESLMETNEDPEGPEHGNCLCVCVIDISAVTDLSFLLWAVVSSCAVVTIYVPYLFLIWYAATDFGIEIFDGIIIMLWFSLASAISRLCVLVCGNHTFFFNRTLFQGGCLGSGIMYLMLQEATTYGWLLVWGLATGLLEGLIVGTIPRVTLLTIPRRYMRCSWSYLVFFNGFSLMIGPFLVVSVNQATNGDIGLACVAIGIIQIFGGILAFFIPNEEYFEQERADAEAEANAVRTSADNEVIDQNMTPSLSGPLGLAESEQTWSVGSRYPVTMSDISPYSMNDGTGFERYRGMSAYDLFNVNGSQCHSNSYNYGNCSCQF